MLAERLPLGAPNDAFLVTSPPLLREVARKLVEVFDHTVEEAAQRRFSLASWTTIPVEDFNEALLDRLAPDRDDDFLIHTAFEGRADFVVTDEPGLLTEGEGTEYTRLDGRTAAAYSFDGFAETIETSTFSLSQVPELLSVRAEVNSWAG